MILNIESTPVFEKLWESINGEYRYILAQGGTRSSKTISILQCIIILCIREKIKVSIVRTSFPSLRGSVMRDFFEILENLELYNQSNHNKTENYYKFNNGSVVEFFSLDSDQKIRGRKRDILFINEGNEVSHNIYLQLAFRTTQKIIIDYNPSDADHWLYDLIKDDKAILLKSTYKDNTFLEQSQIDEIEKLIHTDENYYRIYALGEAPLASIRIYNHFKQYIDLPTPKEHFYGLDFGYNHPTCLIKCYYVEDKIFIEEIVYKQFLTASDMVKLMIDLQIDKQPIYADYSRPEIIEEMKRFGFNVKEANKAVKAGIDSVKTSQIYIHHESTNILREYKLYSWKSNGDQIIDEPIKLNDDAMDAIRYAIHTHKKKSFSDTYTKFY